MKSNGRLWADWCHSVSWESGASKVNYSDFRTLLFLSELYLLWVKYFLVINTASVWSTHPPLTLSNLSFFLLDYWLVLILCRFLFYFLFFLLSRIVARLLLTLRLCPWICNVDFYFWANCTFIFWEFKLMWVGGSSQSYKFASIYNMLWKLNKLL